MSPTVSVDSLSRIIRGSTSLRDIENEQGYSGSDCDKVLGVFKVCIHDLLEATPRLNRVELHEAVSKAFPDVAGPTSRLWASQVHSAVVQLRKRCKNATSGKKLGEFQEFVHLFKERRPRASGRLKSRRLRRKTCSQMMTRLASASPLLWQQ